MTATQWVGLIMTVVCVLAALAALLTDAIRLIRGVPTYSELIWARFADWKNGRGPFPVWGIILPAWFLIGCFGLLMHFFM